MNTSWIKACSELQNENIVLLWHNYGTQLTENSEYWNIYLSLWIDTWIDTIVQLRYNNVVNNIMWYEEWFALENL